jgi:hypothetical protein
MGAAGLAGGPDEKTRLLSGGFPTQLGCVGG